MFVDRTRELAELRAAVALGGPRLLIVYGRRRIGKTYLLQHTWPAMRLFYFLASATTGTLNRGDLLRDLSLWSGQPLDLADFPTWRTVFRLLVDLAREQPLIVVLDEFQHLLGDEDDAASQLAAVWDREARGTQLALVLCGSEVSTMERLLSGGQPLFGRANWSGRIRPFTYLAAAKMVPERPRREQALVYGMFGGSPRHLAVIQPGEPLHAAVIRSILSSRGEIHVQMQTFIEQERGIAEPGLYRAVLAAVAGGNTRLNEIVQASGLGDRPYVARRALEVLENLEIVVRERNFGARGTAPFRYRLADNGVRFWYRFVQPNRSRLEIGEPAGVWGALVEPFVNDYMGKVFEGIVSEAFVLRHTLWDMPGPREWARWEGRDRNRRPIEVDVVSRLDDGSLLTGEIKWSSQPVGVKVHYDLLRDLEDLAASGQGWAREALGGADSRRLYVSAGGFADDFQRLALEDTRVQLVSLPDLYDGP